MAAAAATIPVRGHAGSAHAPHDDKYMWEALGVIALGSFMVVLDTTIVNIALPRIITVFGSSVDESQLVLTGYLLALAIIMPCTQYLSQTFGTKRLYLVTIVMFTLGSMLCGAAWSVPTLIVARVIQGLGGGMVQPLGMGMLFQITPPARRGAVMGVFALPVMVAPILGPTLGGYLTEYVSWRWVFYLNVPVGAAAVLLGMALLRETPIRKGVPFDLLGFVLAALATAPALLAFEDAPSKGFADASVVARLAVSALALPLFVWWELRTEHPLLDVRLFKIPAFAIGAMINFTTTAAMFGAIFLLPLFLQNLRGLGPMESGVLLFPQALASGVSVVLGGRLYDKVGPRPLMVGGLLVLAYATWLLSGLDVTTSDSTIRAILILRGASMGFCMMPAMTAWQAAAPRSQTQAAAAMQNVLRQLYSAFAVAAFATLLQGRIKFHAATLSMFVTPDSPAVARLLGQTQQYALAHGLPASQGQVLAVAQLYGQVQRAAAVRGFDDAFLIAALACAAGIVPTLFVRAARAGGGGHGPVEV